MNKANCVVLGLAAAVMAWSAGDAIGQLVVKHRQATLDQLGIGVVVYASHGFVDRFAAAWEKAPCNACDHGEPEEAKTAAVK